MNFDPEAFFEQISRAAQRAAKRWSVSDVAEHETFNGVAYAGKITRNGAAVGDFENRGDGGATRILFDDDEVREEFAAESARFFPGDAEAPAHLVLALMERAES